METCYVVLTPRSPRQKHVDLLSLHTTGVHVVMIQWERVRSFTRHHLQALLKIVAYTQEIIRGNHVQLFYTTLHKSHLLLLRAIHLDSRVTRIAIVAVVKIALHVIRVGMEIQYVVMTITGSQERVVDRVLNFIYRNNMLYKINEICHNCFAPFVHLKCPLSFHCRFSDEICIL